MLHTKFRGKWSNSSGEDFRMVFKIYGQGGHLGHVTSIVSLAHLSQRLIGELIGYSWSSVRPS